MTVLQGRAVDYVWAPPGPREGEVEVAAAHRDSCVGHEQGCWVG